MTVFQSKKFKWFIGIDVSRNELDFAVMKGKTFLFHAEIGNTPDDIMSFIARLKQMENFTIAKTIFCMEHTGIYCNHLLTTLQRLKANIVLEPAIHIKNSLGNIRGKYDKIDAIRIAEYAYKNREHYSLWQPKRDVILQLSRLNTLRTRIIGSKQALKVALSEQAGFVKKNVTKEASRLCKASINALEKDLKKIDGLIKNVIEADPHLKRIFRILNSIRGIGPVVALHIILYTNEFKTISDPKKFACYAGVAPFVRESGIHKGKAMVSHMANKKMKAMLHVAAVNNLKAESELRAYYDRKVAEGKAKMLVINAMRYKMILRVFACVKQDRLYTAIYERTQKATVSDPEPEVLV